MDCKEFEDKITDYIDGELSPVDKKAFEQHLASCSHCNDKYVYMLEMLDSLHNLTPVDTPPSFSKDVINTIDNGIERKWRYLNIKKVFSYAAVFLLGIFVISAGQFLLPMMQDFSTSNTSDMDAPDTATERTSAWGEGYLVGDNGGDDLQNSEDEQQSTRGDESNKSSVNQTTGILDKDKVIYQGNIYLNVKDVRESSEEITRYIESEDGFMESASVSGVKNQGSTGQSYLTARIPSDKFMEVKDKLSDFGEEINSHHEAVNITTQYRDLTTQLDSLKIQEERLLTYLKEADKMTDMLTIETELNRVRTDINMLQTRLNSYDQQLEYSTLSINLTESKTMNTTIKSPFGELWSNISKGFISSINMLLRVISFLIVLIVKIIPFLVVVIPIGYLVKKFFIKR